MHVYVQKSTRTTFPRRPPGVSGSELSQPAAPSKPAGQMRLGAQLGEQARFAPPAPTVGRSTAAAVAMITSATARGFETMITCEPGRWRTPARSTKTWRLCRRGEEVDKQLVDAFGLVVMHPVRGFGQALDAVEVGYVVTVGLGEVRAEVGVALPPDHQRRRRDRAKLG